MADTFTVPEGWVEVTPTESFKAPEGWEEITPSGGDWQRDAAKKIRDLATRTQPQSPEWWAQRRQESALADADPMASAPAIIREPYYGVAGAAAGIASTVARPFSKETADFLTEQGQRISSESEAARKDDWSPWLSRMYGGAAQSLAQAAVAAPLGSAGIIGSFALTEGNQALYDAEQAGLKGMDRIKYAVIQGGIEGAIAGAFQLAGLGGQEKFIADLAKGVMKTSGKQFLKMTLQELPEELMTEFGHAITESFSGVSPDAMNSENFWPRMRDTVAQTMMTLGLTQATATVAQLRQKSNDLDVMTGKGFVTQQEAEKIGLAPEQAKNRESRKKAVEEQKRQIEQQAQELEKHIPPVDAEPSEGDVFKSPGGGTFVFSNGAWTPQISKEPSDASTVRGTETEVSRGQVEGSPRLRGEGEVKVPAEQTREGAPAREEVPPIAGSKLDEWLATQPQGMGDVVLHNTGEMIKNGKYVAFTPLDWDTDPATVAKRNAYIEAIRQQGYDVINLRYVKKNDGVTGDIVPLAKQPPKPEVQPVEEAEFTATPESQKAFERLRSQRQEGDPPIPEGMTRLYHGNATEGRYTGAAWYSTDREYAANYRPNAELQYVDVPTDWAIQQLDPDGYGEPASTLEIKNDEFGPRRPIAAQPLSPREKAIQGKQPEPRIPPPSDEAEAAAKVEEIRRAKKMQGRKQKAAPVSPPESTTQPTEAKPVSGQRVWREMSADEVDAILNPTTSSGEGIGSRGGIERFWSDNPDLALGQGRNASGIVVELDPSGLNLKEHVIPASPVMVGKEFTTRHPASEFREGVRSVEFKPNARGASGELIRLKRFLQGEVEAGRWTKQATEAGGIIYSKITAAPTQPQTPSEAEVVSEAVPQPVTAIDRLAKEIADREIPLTAKQIRQQAQRKGLNPTAVLTAVRKLRSQPLTGEALEEQRRRSAEGVRQSERQRQREEKRQERFAADVEKIHDAMLAAGWTLDKISDSGSRYYHRGDELARVSDHPANEATQAWIDKNDVREISRLEDVSEAVPPPEPLPEATGNPVNADEHSRLPMFSVYQTQFRGVKKFAVKEFDRGGFGDAMFDTEDEAQAEADRAKQRNEEDVARAAKAKADAEAEKKRQKEHEDSFRGFLSSDPKTKGRQLKVLGTNVKYKGKVVSRKELIESKVSEGWTVTSEGRLQDAGGNFLDARDLTETGIKYARHLAEGASTAVPVEATIPLGMTEDEFAKASDRVKVVKRYGVGQKGRRFAGVEVDGRRIDVVVRESHGDSEITSVPEIRRLAYRKLATETAEAPKSEPLPKSTGRKKPKAEAASETAQREAEEERPDIASAVAEELAKRQEQAQAKKKRSERAAERQAEALSELDDALKRLGKPGKLTSFPAIDTDKLKAAVDATLAAGKYGIASFDKFISTVVERMGERFVRDHAPYLEEAARQTGMTGVTSVDDVLEAIQKTASEEPSGETTGTKNAKTDELRSEAGMEERPPVDAETFQQWEDEAAQRIADDKNYAPSLAEELANNPRPITDVENAALGQYINDLNNRRKAGEDVFDELATAIVASERGGTETGRALASRRGERYADGSLAGFVSQYVASVNETPSTEQMQRFAEMADKIAKLEGEVKETQQKLAQAELDLRIAEAKAAKTKPAQEKRGTKRAVLQKKAADAVEAFKKEWASLGQLGIVSDPKQEADKWIAATKAAGNVVKAYAELGVDSFLELLSNLGQLTANQRKAFREAWTEYRSGMEPVEVPDLSAIGTVARRLTRFAVEAGITEREAVVDAVHQELTDMGFEVDRSGTMAAMSGYGVFRELSKDEVSVKIRAINGELQQILKLEDMQNKRAPKKTGVERREPTDAERRLIKLVNEAKKRGGYVVTDPAKQLKSALGAAKTAARNRIADLQNAIAKRERIVSGQTKLIPDAELADLQKQRDELNKEYQQIFGKSGMSEAAKLKAAEKMLDRRIDELKADLAAGNLEGKPKKSPLTSPEIEAKKLQLEQLKSIREQARLADPAYQAKEAAKQTARYKKSLEQRLKIWEQRRDDAANGILPPKRKPSPIDKEILEKKFQIEQVKRHAQAEIDEAARAKQGKSGKALGFGGDLLDLSQAIMTGYEMSAVLRQGAFYTFGFPKQSSKAIKNAVRAFFSRRADFSIHDDLMSRPNHVDYMRGGLETTAADGPLSHREELIRSRIASWLASKPGAAWALPRWAAEGLLGSERSFRAFANTMRADLFDYMKASIEAARPGTWSEDDAKVIGNASNVFSGRGKLPPSMTGVASSRIFFAPRWVWSRGQLLVGQPLWRGDSKTRLAVGKVYVRAAVGFAAFALLRHYLYAMLAGGDDEEPEYELDPRSSDFGKMRIGDTRIDSGAGLNQLIVLLARLSTGETKQASGKIVPIRGDDVPYGSGDTFEIGARFLRSKLAPLPSGVLDWIVGKNVAGKKVTTGSIIAERTSPMTWRDIWAAEKALNVPQGTVAAIEAFFGEGVTTYGQKTTYRNADEAGRQEIIKKDLKYLQWDSPEKPAYAEFLTPDQLQKFSERRNEKRQQVILDATHEPGRDSHKNDETFQESLEKRDKNIDYLREMKAEGVTLAEAEQILESYYQTDDPATKKDESKISSDENKSLKAKLKKLAELYGE